MVDLAIITKLRNQTGGGMMDCKKALEEANGDYEKAIDLMRQKGEIKAAKKSAERETKEGIVYSYIHSNNKTGAMLELLCETDFVSRTEDFKNLAHELALQIVAMSPDYLMPEQVPVEVLEREKAIYREQLLAEGKKEEFMEKIMEGKLTKFFAETCLLKQLCIKDENLTVEALINQVIAKTGEKIEIGRFSRFQI